MTWRLDKGQHARSFVRFIYGNSGWDVVNDYGMSLEDVLKPVIGIEPGSIASRLERGDFLITF